MYGKQIFNTTIIGLGSILTYIFGRWDTPLTVLVIFMVLDYITGIISGVVQNKLSSSIGFKGILRKASMLLVLIIAVLLDRLLNGNTWVFRTLVCYFYIANEAISLLENVVKIGVPVPKKLVNTLEQLKSKNNN